MPKLSTENGLQRGITAGGGRNGEDLVLYGGLMTISVLLLVVAGMLLLASFGLFRRHTIKDDPDMMPRKRRKGRPPYRDYEDSEDERDETLHYFKEAVREAERCASGVDLDDPQQSTSQCQSPIHVRRGENGTMGSGSSPNIIISKCISTESFGSETPFSVSGSPVHSTKLLGKLMITVQYAPGKENLEICVKEAYDLVMSDVDNEFQLRLTLMPDKKQKFKSDIYETQTSNNNIDETFVFSSVKQDRLSSLAIRIRLYRPNGKGKRDCVLMESLLRCCLIDARSSVATHHVLDLSLPDQSILKPSISDFSVSSRRNSMVDKNQNTAKPGDQRPAIQISLCYTDTTGKLGVGIEQGLWFSTKTKTPDTMVKITLLSPYGEELGKSKTSIKKGDPEPVFAENFIFQAPKKDIRYMSLLIQVYCYLGVWKRKVSLGWLSIGHNSTSHTQEEHWNEMSEVMGVNVTKWHSLKQP